MALWPLSQLSCSRAVRTTGVPGCTGQTAAGRGGPGCRPRTPSGQYAAASFSRDGPSTNFPRVSETRKEGNVIFNDALNTFYLRLYGVTHMVKDHSNSERGNPLLPHRLLFRIIAHACHGHTLLLSAGLSCLGQKVSN